MISNQEIIKRFETTLSKKADNTTSAYLDDIRLFLEAMNNKSLLDITLDDINNYFYKTIDDYAPSSKRRKIVSLNKIYEFIIKRSKSENSDIKYKGVNPLSEVLENFKDFRDVRKENLDVLSTEETKTLIKHIKNSIKQTNRLEFKNTRIRDLAIVSLFLSSGMRASELCTLRMENLDLEEQTILILADDTKSNKNRLIDLFANTIEYLKNYLDVRNSFNPSCDYIFITSKGKPLDYKQIWNMICKYMKECGLEGHTHTLRATYITQMYEQSKDIKMVQEIVGHSSILTTDRYIRNKQSAEERRKKTKCAFSNL